MPIICAFSSLLSFHADSIPILYFDTSLEILSLYAKEGEEKVTILSNSSYHHSRDYVNSDRTNNNIYPCVYTVRTNNIPTLKWSSVNDKGHFNIPKVIFGNGASGVIVDKNGEYGMTQFAYAIVDNIEDLENIKKALESEYFIKKIMLFKNSLGDRYNRKMISNFRKNFWKKFI